MLIVRTVFRGPGASRAVRDQVAWGGPAPVAFLALSHFRLPALATGSLLPAPSPLHSDQSVRV